MPTTGKLSCLLLCALGLIATGTPSCADKPVASKGGNGTEEDLTLPRPEEDTERTREETSPADAGATQDVDVTEQDAEPALTCACGNGSCQTACGEDGTTCPDDCKHCGDGVCSPGEGPVACALDCCGTCGDGRCMGEPCNERAASCPSDCGTTCGDRSCDLHESPTSCPEDCVWGECGNRVCEPSDGGVSACPTDCAPTCGNCTCDPGEDYVHCPADCGWCGDGLCSSCADVGESASSCHKDCGKPACSVSDPTPCADKDPCTIDLCTPSGSCQHYVTKGLCNDLDACTIGETCATGLCKGGEARDCDDHIACTVDSCSPDTGCDHVPSGLACDDGNACTDDACSTEKGCIHDFSTASCDDGNTCTEGDTCKDGGCHPGKPANCDDGDLCTDDACKQGEGCTHVNNTAACDDGNICTKGDACTLGLCVAGTLPPCDDGNPCTLDTCHPVLGCEHAPATTCDDGDACTVGDVCVAGLCAGKPVSDPNEPNETAPGKSLGDKDDYAEPSKAVYGLSPATDVDWLSFRAVDDDCTGIAHAWVEDIPKTEIVGLCGYFTCDGGDKPDVKCLAGSPAKDGPGGAKGCCTFTTATDAAHIALDATCSFMGMGDDSGTVNLKVWRFSGALSCLAYTLRWSDKE